MKLCMSFFTLGFLLMILISPPHINIASSQTDAPTITPTTSNRKIVFVSARDGDFYIYTMDTDGKNQHRLAGGIHPVWSPYGNLIAFTAPNSKVTPVVKTKNRAK